MNDPQGLMSDDLEKKSPISDALRRKSKSLSDKVIEKEDEPRQDGDQ